MMDDIAAMTLSVTTLNGLWSDMAGRAKNALQTVSDAVKKVNDTLADTVKATTAITDAIAALGKEHEVKLNFDKLKEAGKTAEELKDKIEKLGLPHDIATKGKSYGSKAQEQFRHVVGLAKRPYDKIHEAAVRHLAPAARLARRKLNRGHVARTAFHARGIAKKGLIDIPKGILSFATALTPMGLLKKGTSYGFDKFKDAGKKRELPNSISGVYNKGVSIVDTAKVGGGQILEKLVPTFDKLISVGDSFMKIIPKMVNALQPLIDAINDIPFKEMLDPLIEMLPPVIHLVSNFVGILLKTLSPVIKSLTPLIKPVLTVLTSVGNVLMSVLSPYLKMVSFWFSFLGKVISLLAPVLQWIGNAFNWIANLISKVSHGIAETARSVKSFFTGEKDTVGKAKETKQTLGMATITGPPPTAAFPEINKTKDIAGANSHPGKSKGTKARHVDMDIATMDGTSSATITIQGPLINNFTIHTRNINEAYDKVRDEVTKVLVDMFHHKIAI